MSMGDVEPEDAWDIGDAAADQVHNLTLRAALLDLNRPANGRDRLRLRYLRDDFDGVSRRQDIDMRTRSRLRELRHRIEEAEQWAAAT